MKLFKSKKSGVLVLAAEIKLVAAKKHKKVVKNLLASLKV